MSYKGLIGISPSGSVTFFSRLFDGSISEIVSRSGFLEPPLWNSQDSVMADRGFVIYDELKEPGVVLNIPCFLAGRDLQTSTAAEVKESPSIASIRIHVERAIQRIKKLRMLRNEIPLSFHGTVNQIWTVCCMLCNFMTLLIQKDMESG